MLHSSIKFILYIIVSIVAIFLVFILIRKPSHDRQWELGQEKLPFVIIDGKYITVKNVRDFEWTGPYSANKNYISQTYNLNDLINVKIIVSHFSDFEGMAHIFLNFGFEDGRHLNISIEARRESNEKYSPLLGLFRQYEIIYVVATDRDIIGLRTDHRDERVHIFPTLAPSKDKVRELFLLLAEDINKIYYQPLFYNTLFRNCTNQLTKRVEDISDIKFPLTYKTLFPGLFPEVLYKIGLIDNTKPYNEVKKDALIDNNKVDALSPNYSTTIHR